MIPPDSAAETSDQSRRATVSTEDGSALGVCLYLTPADLRALGIDPECTDAISYEIDAETGQLTIRDAADGGEE